MKLLLSSLGVTAGMILLVVLIMAAMLQPTTTWRFCESQNTLWSNSNNWWDGASCNSGSHGVPDADDKALIVSGKTAEVDISNAEAAHLEVESTATLKIQAGSSGNDRILTLSRNQATDSTINGTLTLEGQYSKLKFITTSHILLGTGTIIGKHNDALIDFNSGDIGLTSDLTIEGNLTIQANNISNVFTNRGTVNANRNGTLLIDNCKIEDLDDATHDPVWKVSAVTTSGAAKLQFDHDVTNPNYAALDGVFSITQGTLRVNSNIVTTGKLSHYSGNAEAAAGRFIRFSDL